MGVEMQSVVGVLRVHLPFFVGEIMEEIQIIHPFFDGHDSDQLVDAGDVLPALGVSGEKAVAVVGGEDALDDDMGFRRLFFDTLHDGAYAARDTVVAGPTGHVVGADHQEDHRGLALGDGLETVEYPGDDVAADATVLASIVLEELAPLTAVGDAVAQEDDVTRRGGHALEKQLTLVVIRAELAGDLGGSLSRHQKDEGEQ